MSPSFRSAQGHVKVHAYTDDAGVTLFRVIFPDGRQLDFGAHLTNFELESHVEIEDSMFGGAFPGRRDTHIELSADVTMGPTYTTAPPQEEIGCEVRQIGSARKEIEQ